MFLECEWYQNYYNYIPIIGCVVCAVHDIKYNNLYVLHGRVCVQHIQTANLS